MPRETPEDFEAVLRSSALLQHRAAELRFAGTPPGTEPAREVFRAACAEVGSALQPLDFKYSKSAQHCVRDAGTFTHVVSFQSSHNNVSGHHVRLWMHAVVRSKALKRWRVGRLPENLINDHVAGGMVHRLSGVHAMVEWELADPRTRAETVANIVEFVKSDVLPYFERFGDPAGVIEELANAEIPAFDLMPSIEFSLLHGDKAKGQAVLDRFIRDRPDLLPAIAEAERQGLSTFPYGPGSFAETVAFARRTFGLQ